MTIRDYFLPTRLLRTRPLFSAALMLLFGCILGYTAELPILYPAVLLATCLVCATLLRRKKRAAAALCILAMLPLGMLHFSLAWQKTQPFPDQPHAQLTGRICEAPAYDSESQRTICVLDEIAVNGVGSSKKLRLYLRGDIEKLQAVAFGQIVSCEAHIWQADEATNPGQFNFSNYLRLRGLSGYATAEIEEAVFTEASSIPFDGLIRLRAKLGAHIDRLFPDNSEIARAFLLGDRSELSEDARQVYANSGAAHLLAISGMHISVLAMAVSMLLGRFTTKRSGFFITIVLLLAYGVVLGFSASLTRAILMFAVFGGAAVAGRHSDGLTRIGAALAAYLLLRPTAILDAGFVLSYSASAGIILFYEPVSHLLHADAFQHRKRHSGIKGLLFGIAHWIISMLIATLSAQLAVLPATVYYFGAQPIFSILVNLYAVPLAMSAYIISIIGAVSCLPPVAAAGDCLFGLLTGSLSFFAGLPVSTLRIASFPTWLVFACAAACLLASGISKLNIRVRRFLPLMMIAAVFIANGCSMLTTLGCSVVFLDAGHADCAVLRTEGKVYLFDTGDSYSPVSDYFSAMNYPLEAVFLSHMHDDHAGGLKDLLEVQVPKRIYISANWDTYEAADIVSQALDRARSLGCEIIPLSAGDSLQLSGETLLQVYAPTAGISAPSANDDSLVLHVEHNGTSVLFTGDASADAIAGGLPDADILKVAHHGGSDALSQQLLMEVTPSAAIIPAGYNTYGHPKPKTLELLELAGAEVFRTGECGAITCRFGENGRIFISTYK